MNKSTAMPVSIYALGGLGEVGKNMYCIENDESIIIIDCGVKFPGVELPGIDFIVPDFSHLKNNRNKIKALIITHGHEDHIGGIPFLIQHVNIPVVYAPRLAAALIKNRLDEYKMTGRLNVLEYDNSTKLTVGGFDLSFFRVTHSIPDSYGVIVDTSEGRIISTGDFKVDLTPIGPDFDLHRIAQLGEEGVDLLLSDSTNAESEGYTPSEKNVYDSIDDIFVSSPGRIIVSTFSSNISRIQQVCEIGVAHNRKIVIVGRSMEKAVEISRSYGYIKVPDSSIIDSSEIKQYKNSELLIICTGSQGETMAALSRIASGEHKDIKIIPGDTVVFSSSAIPGNGIMIDHVVNLLTREGAECITNSILNDIHSSGHPSKQELRLVLKLLKPKYFMPMHGEYRMLRIHAELAETVGIPLENSFVLDNGDCLTLANHKVKRGYQVEHGVTYIDGKDINGLAEPVMKDRLNLTDEGMLAITLTIDPVKNEIVGDPLFISKGFIIGSDKKIQEQLRNQVTRLAKEMLARKTNLAEIKNTLKVEIGKSMYSLSLSKPMIIPIVLVKNS